ncbi:MAG: hypothetical protein GXY83_05360 [Rhodopirellula sp.]|nr:hypothetical protein [Rhodopirellula sp.]
MAEFDEFAQQLLEESKRFCEKAKEESSKEGKLAYLHAAINIGFCALEAHVNDIADDFLTRPELSALDKGILAERDVRLVDGEYQLSNSLKMYRLDERIQFVHRRFSGRPLDRNASWWSDLKSGLDLRNKLTHPKELPTIKEGDVERALRAVIDTLSALYDAVYGTGYPAAGRGLDSRLSF